MALEYDEIDFYGNSKKILFEYICPKSSGTLIQQTEKIDPEGLTLVTECEVEIFNKIFSELSEIQNFISAPYVHSTMLGLFDIQRKNNSYYESLVIEEVIRFFGSENYDFRQLRFNYVRPGTYYKPKTTDQMFRLGNGTVFANGDLKYEQTKNFRYLGIKLSKHLRYVFSEIFDENFAPKFNNVWCTLGYFNSEDFLINQDFESKFKSPDFMKFDKSCRIKGLYIGNYSTRSLDNFNKLQSIPLSN
jgi:hypothetical protein